VASKLRIAFLTHEPFYPPSGGGSAEAVYLVQEMARRGHEVHVFCPRIANAEEIGKRFGIWLHSFNRWSMSRYVRFRNFKYLAYPFFLERMVIRAARETKFDLLVSQHAISAVAAGRLKRKLAVPVVMNFPDRSPASWKPGEPGLRPVRWSKRSNGLKFPCRRALGRTVC